MYRNGNVSWMTLASPLRMDQVLCTCGIQTVSMMRKTTRTSQRSRSAVNTQPSGGVARGVLCILTDPVAVASRAAYAVLDLSLHGFNGSSMLCFAAQGLLPKDPRQPVHNLQQTHTSSLEVCPASVSFPHSSAILYFCCNWCRALETTT